MSFTEEKFISLSYDNKLKKILFAIKEFWESSKDIDYIKNLVIWFNKCEKVNIVLPDKKSKWEEVYNKLFEELYRVNPYIEKSPFDDIRKNRIELPIKLILDNIRSPFNVGSIIRNSEAFGVNEVIFCGITPTPETNIKIQKTSRRALVASSYYKNTCDAINLLKAQDYKIYSIEKTCNSKDIDSIIVSKQAVLLLGNEEFGISKEVLDLSDEIVHIPMSGFKNSINVSVAAGIALYNFYLKIQN